MRMYPSRILCYAMALLALSTVPSGCVKRMSAANEPAQTEAARFAALRSVTVSADASRIELTSDKPFTYTSYKAGEPAKIVVDISQTEPGAVATPIEVNRGNLRRIDLVRQPVGGGVLTRVELSLAKDVDFAVATDPSDKTRLLITLAPPEPEAAPVPADSKEAPLAEATIEEKTLTPEVVVAAGAEQAGGQARGAEQAGGSSPERELQQPEPKAAAATLPEPKVEPVPPAAAERAAAESPVAVVAQGGDNPAPAAGRKEQGPSGSPRLNAIIPASDGVELSIDGGVQTFNSFRLSNPERIVLDMFGMKSVLASNVVPIGAFGIASARVGSTPDKVRVVLDTEQGTLPPFEVVKSDLGLKIRLKTPGGGAPAARPAAVAAARAPLLPAPVAAAPLAVPAVPPPASVKTEVPPGRQAKGALEALDFQIVEGVSRITMKLYGSCDPAQPVHGVQGLSLTIRNCEVPKQLQRTLDTSQFGSPVLSVTPYQVKVKGLPVTKLLVRLRGNPPFTMNRKGDILVWDIRNPGALPAPKLPPPPAVAVRPAPEPKMVEELVPQLRSDEAMTEISTPDSARRAPRKVYKGRRVTLEFSDADVRKIFQLIAEVSNLNFLIADDVTGTISIKLVNVPWDQALDVILDAKGLGMQRDGNIVQIKPKAKIQTQAEEELAAKIAAERTMELRTAVFEVNYASVSDVATQFNALKSERGSISRDERTSRVIVKDIQPALEDMRSLLKTLDAPERQVMIEARIVEATSTFTRDLGVQWGLHYRDGSASVLGINTVDTGFGGVVSPAGPGSSGAGGIGLGMSFGKLNSNVQLDMRLSAAATIGQVKIISTPKVVTLNNKAAKISQGQSIPYQTTSAEGTKTEFVEAALTLEVTPHITADGAVSMKIKASNNSPGSGSPPPINKKEATTELVVANGETTVIGGIYVDSDTESDTGIPFLSDIPLLGWLFKSNNKVKTKTELLIFITPKVVL
ncbi:MAG: pilus assembly protein PilQ [Geobacteraceae bacterium GWC2_58_44]|nr:MAG: pilus assembly protein PilQ [Geobacteraceae bacterium GWC2_58_44]HBG08261.1 type IV pilus secretin PilQ [Geobacter sp.]